MTEHDATETLERLINLGHLSSGVGHHVINAFSAIVSNAELLRLTPPVADPAALADTIIKAALEAANVARRLIDYTRPVTSIEPDRAAFDPQTVGLDVLTAEFVATEQAKERPGITWRTKLAPIPSIPGHSTQLRSMLANLLQNSYDALHPSGGTIQIATSLDARGWIVLEISDDGRGMDARTLEQAVEPFFSTKPGHLGVGLSIAHGIWRRHRGTLSIQSQPAQGTTLRLCVEPPSEAARTSLFR
jgi:two-component system, NtrC family, sensor kinase